MAPPSSIKLFDWRWCAMIFACASAACAPASAADSVTGYGQAIDGDSLRIGNEEVRLFGIDAPEWTQTCQRGGDNWTCGEAARTQLAKIVDGRQVICVSMERDQHGRLLGKCQAGKVDINEAMVASGYATAYRHYSGDYVPAEERAKRAKLGLWSGTFTRPEDFRHAQVPNPERRSATTKKRQPSAPTTVMSGDCVIKGNRGSNGWIYHIPGMPYYERTKAEEMFCTEAEAQAGGYRRARVR